MFLIDLRKSFAGMVLFLSLCSQANAHAMLPSKWEAVEQSPDRVSVSWVTPAMLPAGVLPPRPLPLAGCSAPEAYRPSRDGVMYVETWLQHCPGGLAGRSLSVEGLVMPGQQVLARVRYHDGRQEDALLDLGRPTRVIGTANAEQLIARAYFSLGVEHILKGWDHLAFILVLVLAGWRLATPPPARWILTRVTSFTAGHSITLMLAALGWVSVSSRAVEVGIALSIVWVAWTVWLDRHSRAPMPAKPAIGLVFGLLHGLGFAGSLADIGLPADDQLPALLWFNLGIETGQLVFVLACLAPAFLLLDRLPGRRRWRSLATSSVAVLASYWFWSRLLSA